MTTHHHTPPQIWYNDHAITPKWHHRTNSVIIPDVSPLCRSPSIKRVSIQHTPHCWHKIRHLSAVYLHVKLFCQPTAWSVPNQEPGQLPRMRLLVRRSMTTLRSMACPLACMSEMTSRISPRGKPMAVMSLMMSSRRTDLHGATWSHGDAVRGLTAWLVPAPTTHAVSRVPQQWQMGSGPNGQSRYALNFGGKSS